MKLTDKQKIFLGYISHYIEAWGRSPSFDEICAEFKFGSYNTVTTYLKILERKGYIRLPREKNRKRAIEVITTKSPSTIPSSFMESPFTWSTK